MPKRSSTTVRAATMLTISLALVAGCTSGDDSSPPITTTVDPYADEFEQAKARATTDFEREILEDGAVTREEYDAAEQKYVECLEGRDVNVSIYEVEPGYNNYEVPGQERDQDMFECADGTNGVVAGIYIDRLLDPNNVGLDQLTVDCLKNEGLLDDEFTVEDWKDLSTVFIVEDGQETVEIPPADSLPFNDTDPRADACISSPASVRASQL